MPACGFHARGKRALRILSNLATVEEGLVVRGARFRSVEAAYVWLFKFDGQHAEVFGYDGVLGSFAAYAAFVEAHPDAALGIKVASWAGAEGILAKVAGGSSKAAYTLRRVLGMAEPRAESFHASRDMPLWRELHEAKFAASAAFRTCLRQTGKCYLYEFDRGSGRLTQEPSLWGGCFTKDGTWRGRNVMGHMLMDLRCLKTRCDI